MIIDETLLELDSVIESTPEKILEVIVPVVFSTYSMEDKDKITVNNGYARDFVEVIKICESVAKKNNGYYVPILTYEPPAYTAAVYHFGSSEKAESFHRECMKLFQKNKYIINSARNWIMQSNQIDFKLFQSVDVFIIFRYK